MAGEEAAPVVVPEWPAGTACVLVTADVHAIPVSTAMRTGERTVVFGLGRRRDSLARLRRDARCALAVMSAARAFTVYGTAREAGEVEGVVAVVMDVDRVVDHMTTDFVIDAGVSWRWVDDAAAARDAAIRAGLRSLHG